MNKEGYKKATSWSSLVETGRNHGGKQGENMNEWKVQLRGKRRLPIYATEKRKVKMGG